MAGRAADLAYGRTLPRLLREHRLIDVAADAYFPITAPACTALERATVEQIRDRLISADIATAAEIDQHLHNIDTERVPDLATSPMISAWGREPRTRPAMGGSRTSLIRPRSTDTTRRHAGRSLAAGLSAPICGLEHLLVNP
jgi:hypothetical protein